MLFHGSQRSWKTLVENYYFGTTVSPTTTSCIKDEASLFLKKCSESGPLIFSSFTSTSVSDGKHALFQDDLWARDANLKNIFPTLFWLAIDRTCSVVVFMSKPIIDENFRQPLPQHALNEILELKILLQETMLLEIPDK